MSFILDALKKSESDRQRQSGPSLFEVKVAPPRRTLPVWALVIAVLLGINVIVISWMLLRHPAAQQPAAAGNAEAAAPPPATLVQAGGGAVSSAAPVVRAGSGTERPGTASTPATQPPATAGSPSAGPGAAEPPASATGAAAPLAGSSRFGQPSTAPPPAGGADRGAAQPPAGDNSSDSAPAAQPAATPDSEAGAAGAGDLPLYQQIAANAGLPALHLDLHVFADRPQDRFVMINMHRVGEGDSLPSGVQVEAIRPDGVVLTYRGTRFLLPRN